ncbi:5-amino-6-(5-phosphoribosylamino)uracil reductase [Sorangium cellulosum]|uniref:5-amino-6-(5-phosphoribosylamino)uracil reductase n=1 Tax=Sorangium cellulosum TaxID=56 RepID=A0A2L0F1S4_SORCE|nr:RibD family protein [Sorangium cellulosum]AUX45514.1 5-amino-6-(5-phosphoribosylamino)uracil reductase [Sorangium cellulosum]
MILPRPLVTLHFAQTLDGRIATPGERVALSTPAGIEHAHRARADHDAVLVGARTVMIDDPLLTVRACAGPQPMRVVLASALGVPDRARLLAASGKGQPAAGRVLVVGAAGRATDGARARLEERGAEVVLVPATDCGRVSLPHALAELHARGVRRLLVEGGGIVLTSFLRARLADRAEVEIAPRLLGDTAIPAVGALGEATLASAIDLREPAVELLGGNVLLRGDIGYPD